MPCWTSCFPVSGMDVLDKIVNLPRDGKDNPFERVDIVIKIIESGLDNNNKVPQESKGRPDETKAPAH